MKTQNVIINEMAQFKGTVNYWEHKFFKLSLRLTDGADYIRKNCGAYWLFDLIVQQAYQTDKSYVVKLQNTKESVYKFNVHDWQTDEIIYQQEILFSDFPLKEIKLYVLNGIFLLPSEY